MTAACAAITKRSCKPLTTFCTLFSGSSGNVTYLGTDRGAILIDCGMSGSQVLHAMEEAGLNPGDLSAILVG